MFHHKKMPPIVDTADLSPAIMRQPMYEANNFWTDVAQGVRSCSNGSSAAYEYFRMCYQREVTMIIAADPAAFFIRKPPTAEFVRALANFIIDCGEDTYARAKNKRLLPFMLSKFVYPGR